MGPHFSLTQDTQQLYFPPFQILLPLLPGGSALARAEVFYAYAADYYARWRGDTGDGAPTLTKLSDTT